MRFPVVDSRRACSTRSDALSGTLARGDALHQSPHPRRSPYPAPREGMGMGRRLSMTERSLAIEHSCAEASMTGAKQQAGSRLRSSLESD